MTHREIYPAHVLFDEYGTITGVLDWTTARVDDPARDLAAQYGAGGEEMLQATLAVYEQAGGHVHRAWPPRPGACGRPPRSVMHCTLRTSLLPAELLNAISRSLRALDASRAPPRGFANPAAFSCFSLCHPSFLCGDSAAGVRRARRLHPRPRRGRQRPRLPGTPQPRSWRDPRRSHPELPRSHTGRPIDTAGHELLLDTLACHNMNP